MIISLAIMTILGLLVNALLVRIKLPGLLGMLLLGILLGPYGLNVLSPDLLQVSDDLRRLALIIILIRAGLGIHKEDLIKVGGSAVRISFIPGILEGFTIAFLAIRLFGFTFIEGGILGFVIAAVSPAVIVPQMLKLLDQKLGTGQGVPTLILAGASIDDVFAITLFSAFIGLYTGSNSNLTWQILEIPISIILGIGLGVVFGLLLGRLYKDVRMRDTRKVLILLGAAILMKAIESWVQSRINIAALLGVMSMGFVLMERKPEVSRRMASKLNKMWVLAEIVLFVLVGAQVDVTIAINAGLLGLLIILAGLAARTVGVLLATLGSHFTWKERLFCAIAYLPKATVQASIGGIPLSMGVESGGLILALAVVAILFTAPLGAIGIDKTAPLLLVREEAEGEVQPVESGAES